MLYIWHDHLSKLLCENTINISLRCFSMTITSKNCNDAKIIQYKNSIINWTTVIEDDLAHLWAVVQVRLCRWKLKLERLFSNRFITETFYKQIMKKPRQKYAVNHKHLDIHSFITWFLILFNTNTVSVVHRTQCEVPFYS